MFTILVIFHVIVSVSLILVVLLQSAKGEGLAGGTAFGGSVSSAVFGGRGAASFLSKATTVLAIVFFLNSGALALLSARRPVAPGTPAAAEGESAVTRLAQEELERIQQQQQLLQNLDTTGAVVDTQGAIQVLPGEAAPDTGGQ